MTGLVQGLDQVVIGFEVHGVTGNRLIGLRSRGRPRKGMVEGETKDEKRKDGR